MAPRANWKGFLSVGALSCQVALYTAASTSERIAFHTLNRKTGHRVKRQFVDEESGAVVDSEDQVKGYQVSNGEYVILEPEEIAAAVPETDKTLAVDSFLPCGEIDTVYLDKPYYLAPADEAASEAFVVIRDGLKSSKSAALARTVLFRRVRTLLIRPHGEGLIANTLNFDYEVRSAKEAFADVPKLDIKGEMLELAEHIIKTKRGKFDPADFEDRYEGAVADLVKAKIEGRKIEPPKRPRQDKVVDLMQALRESAGMASGKGGRATKAKKPTARKTSSSGRRAAASTPRRKAS